MLFIGLLVGAIVTLIVYIAYMLIIAFTLWMVVDAAKQDRFWWVLICIAVPIIGSAVYYLTEKKHEYAKAESHHIHNSQTELQHEVDPLHHKHHKKEGDAPILLAEEKKEDEGEKKENA